MKIITISEKTTVETLLHKNHYFMAQESLFHATERQLQNSHLPTIQDYIETAHSCLCHFLKSAFG